MLLWAKFLTPIKCVKFTLFVKDCKNLKNNFYKNSKKNFIKGLETCINKESMAIKSEISPENQF